MQIYVARSIAVIFFPSSGLFETNGALIEKQKEQALCSALCSP
jgi:hypothetical protein